MFRAQMEMVHQVAPAVYGVDDVLEARTEMQTI